ncbi:MAG: asparagine synthase (glutamine-hydrolyzing) [Deferrisomatales bacterium]
MCGICGVVRFDGQPVPPEYLERACDALRHRGPDDGGAYVDGPVGLGHRRLSIIDLSPSGHQPMANEDRTVWIVFNGEIYNFQELRPALEARGHLFRSRTDTEVLLHLYEDEGPRCLERLRGMFAFAVWDARDRSLFLARDRVGKKPLFYCHREGFFSFASALSALVCDPGVPREVDPVAIHHYLTFQSVPAPFTAYRAVRKLPPGHWLMLRDGRAELRRYWDLRFGPKAPADTPARREGLVEELRERAREAVRIRLVSDVPLGALLSGGVDSGGVVALMASQPGAPVRTFSVGFEEKEYDELPQARLVAARYGTAHQEFTLRPDMVEALPALVEHFGEPFADPAAIPLYFITRLARQHVTVALCGDGGDEGFAGYHRHRLNALLRGFDFIPPAVSQGLFRLLSALPHGPPSARSPLWIAKRFFQTLSLPPEIRNLRFFGHFDEAGKRALYTPEYAEILAGADTDDLVRQRFQQGDADNLLDRILYTDFHSYLPDTLLPKVDVTSMANSLEMRSPLLDHQFLEFAARLPADLKLRRGTSKYALKEAFRPLLPPEILKGPKRGFGVPLDRWFRGELRELVRDTLLGERARARGWFCPQVVERLLSDHETGRWQGQYQIYNLLMLELWHRRFVDGDREP